MFRKITYIILAFLLLTTTLGFTVSKHYCGSELIEVSINSKAEPCCDDVGTSGCCRNEMEYYQLKEDVVSPIYFESIQIANFDILFPLIFDFLSDASSDNEIDVLNFAESPPQFTIQAKLSLMQTYLC